MDIDPDYPINDTMDDFYGDNDGYDGDFEDRQESEEDQQVEEFDADGSPVYMATAAAFGYHMAQDEIEEREIAEDILRRKEKEYDTSTKIPLASRHETKGKMTPFGRWATMVNNDPSRLDTKIKYTPEEQLVILDAEGGKDDWDG